MSEKEFQAAAEKILAEIRGLFDSFEIENRTDAAGGVTMLKARLTELGSVGGEALMEICLLPRPFELGGGKSVAGLQIYTTLAANIEEYNLAPALGALSTLNQSCPLGTVELNKANRQIYHRFTQLLALPVVPTGPDEAVAAVKLCVQVASDLYDEVIIIAEKADGSRFYS